MISQHIIELFFQYIIGVLAVASLLMAWFHTELMVHLIHILRRLGWRKNTDFWDQIPEFETTKEDLDNYLAIFGKYPLINDLFSCPICLSFHISLWTAVAMYFLCDTSIAFAIGQVMSYPIIANIILKIKEKL